MVSTWRSYFQLLILSDLIFIIFHPIVTNTSFIPATTVSTLLLNLKGFFSNTFGVFFKYPSHRVQLRVNKVITVSKQCICVRKKIRCDCSVSYAAGRSNRMKASLYGPFTWSNQLHWGKEPPEINILVDESVTEVSLIKFTNTFCANLI